VGRVYNAVIRYPMWTQTHVDVFGVFVYFSSVFSTVL
jgi:hypothetical protein